MYVAQALAIGTVPNMSVLSECEVQGVNRKPFYTTQLLLAGEKQQTQIFLLCAPYLELTYSHYIYIHTYIYILYLQYTVHILRKYSRNLSKHVETYFKVTPTGKLLVLYTFVWQYVMTAHVYL